MLNIIYQQCIVMREVFFMWWLSRPHCALHFYVVSYVVCYRNCLPVGGSGKPVLPILQSCVA